MVNGRSLGKFITIPLLSDSLFSTHSRPNCALHFCGNQVDILTSFVSSVEDTHTHMKKKEEQEKTKNIPQNITIGTDYL